MMTQQKEEPGLRYDAGKARYDLIPADVLDALAIHYTKGAAKYSDRNWEKGMSFGRCFGSLMRHAWAFWRGEEIDPETGSHHMIAAAWNCFALAAYRFRGVGTDDRPAVPDVPDEHEEGELLWSAAARRPTLGEDLAEALTEVLEDVTKENPHSGSTLESAFTPEEWAGIEAKAKARVAEYVASKPDTADPAWLDTPMPPYMDFGTCATCPTPVYCKTRLECATPLPDRLVLSRDCP